MLKYPLWEGHVIAIFIDNIFPKLKFIDMDYMKFFLHCSKVDIQRKIYGRNGKIEI